MAFELPQIPYAYDALEPHIDARTMEIHHTKHHAAYTNNFNEAIDAAGMADMSIEDIFKNMGDNMVIRNNGGGFYNHSLFWTIMSPTGGGKPTGDLDIAINDAYDSFDGFKATFTKAAITRFGSGWAWLCVHKGGKVEVCSTANQDNSLMPGVACGGTPILGLDVWEHAYYLNFQNKRPDYVSAFWNIVNWDEVSRRYALGK